MKTDLTPKACFTGTILNPVSGWWMEEVLKNNPTCAYWVFEIVENNPPGP